MPYRDASEFNGFLQFVLREVVNCEVTVWLMHEALESTQLINVVNILFISIIQDGYLYWEGVDKRE